ncbi:MAG: site-2 protease family protein [Alphaproteobacteria bacterium]|nr:site-2 protease family protein [Alphaproteobacteria bacterium]
MLLDLLTMVPAAVVMIGVLVFVHEAGHFVAAKIFGVGVPVFSIGMGARLFGFEWRGTDYRVSAVPIGGYVLMSGADPFGEEDVSQHVPPDEDFMRKPVWQRLIIMAAGPGVNLALPFVLFTVLLMAGRPDWNSRVGTIAPGSVLAEAGVRTGDAITSVDGAPVVIWRDVLDRLEARLGTDGDVALTLSRDGAEQTVSFPASALTVTTHDDLDAHALGVVTGDVPLYPSTRLEPVYFTSRVGVESPDAPAARAGVRTGDLITAVDGVDVDRWDALSAALGTGGTHTVAVDRLVDATTKPPRIDHLTFELSLDGAPYAPPVDDHADAWGLAPAALFANRIEPGSPAEAAGVRSGDRFVAVDGTPVRSFNHLIDLVARTTVGRSDARPLDLELVRDGQARTVTITPDVMVITGEAYSRPIIGAATFPGTIRPIDEARKYWSLTAAVPQAARESVEALRSTISILRNIATNKAKASDNVGGPVSIMLVAGTVAKAGVFQFATTIGMISVSIGVINLLPIPVLDGGQILFYLVEAVRGRALSLELRERVQMVGVVALMIALVLVTYNDIARAVSYYFASS